MRHLAIAIGLTHAILGLGEPVRESRHDAPREEPGPERRRAERRRAAR
ncbi:hypothetical protein [Sphaerisporangium corydalis]|uniref:Uncharacterized protein n=1 Tax=Sphaerisporangium corydalis TaxID=1441875 RepID=A0ABV9EEI6_9ACTN|nr:hypothetical protein [Sphaerisporangium corydalis]